MSLLATLTVVSILFWGTKNQNRINSSDFVDYGLAPLYSNRANGTLYI